MTSDSMSPADIAAVTGNRGMNGGFGYGEGNSGARRGRDSMGRYTEGGSYGYRDGGYSGRRYSREEGRSYLSSKLEKMMEEASSEEEREVLQSAMSRLKNM